MNPTAIYSKSGKGVQEASGKTSHLKRPDRAVLSAIDGRATLAEVAEKVGRPFDPAFEALITQLDKDGFVREVSPGVAPKAATPPPAPKGKPAPPPSEGEDLDFSAIIPAAPRPAAPPPPPPKPSGPSPAELKAKADAEKRAREQNEALAKARQEAEARAQADRERMRKEAEEKIRAETEARMRAEAEAKMKADTDAKAKVIRAAAEAKVKAEAEAKKAREEAERAKKEAEEKAAKAREEAERARKEADEKAERARKEAEEKARREQEEMRKQLEAERKAREEAEKKAKEEAERARKEAEEKAKREQEEMRRQLEEERKRMEAERKAREEEDRKRREQEEQERAARRKKEEEEERARKKQREEEEARYRKEEEERVARRKREEEEEKKRQEERALRQKEEQEERARREKEESEERARKQSEATMLATPAVQPPPPPPPPPPAQQPGSTTGGFADSLLADLDSFGQREEEERKEKEEAERKAREAEEKRRREAEDKRRREEEERARREAEDKRRREEEERARREEEDRRQREEEERARMQSEERKRKAREALAAQQASSAAPAAGDDDIGVSEDDLDMDDVKADEAKVSAEARKAKREREREKAEAEVISKATVGKSRRPVKWGKPVAIGLFVLLVAGVGVIHVMPVSVGEYENAASEALGQPVKLGSGRLSLITGPRVTFQNVSVGSVKIATVRGHPDFGSLFGAKKSFSRIELEGMTLPQEALGEAIFAKFKGDNFRVARVTATQMKLVGPLTLPPLDLDATLGTDAVRAVTLRGPDQLMARITPKDSEAEFEMTTGGFAVPFAPEVKFSAFGMKGTANRQGMNIASWDGSALTGTLTGTATIRWGSTWTVDGVITARGLNAGVFAPALLSEGRGEGTGKFSMNGEPAQLAASSRLDANFTVTKGALSVFDLSRAIQTGGRQASGRTPFAEMNGQATYDKGAVALRNVTMGAGALNAGISADIAETGALSGRIVADVKTATQTLRATFSLGGTVKEPQVRN